MFKKIKEKFKNFFSKNKIKYKIIPIFVPHLGCPEDCVFCNQVKIAGALPNISKEEAKKIIDQHLETIGKDKNTFIEIAFFGGSFTAINEEYQNMLLELAKRYIEECKVDGIRISTRPDKIDKKVLQRLKKYGVTTVELGIQSSNDYILKVSRRGHSFKDVINASKLIKKAKMNFGAQMMIGLPESTYKDEIQTANDIIKLKPNMVRIYPTLVVKNTDLEKMYENGTYEPISLNEAVELTKEISKMFINKNIDIIRIGLQTTDEICDPNRKGSSIIAGPYHENFRELVDSKIWYEKISLKIAKLNSKIKEAKIIIHPKNASKVLGYKKENLKRIKQDYNIDIIPEYKTNMPLDKFELEIKEVFEFDDLNIIGDK